MLENKILTWDNFIKRGGIGPIICLLCNRETKIVNRLIVRCYFSQVVWEGLKDLFKINFQKDFQIVNE